VVLAILHNRVAAVQLGAEGAPPERTIETGLQNIKALGVVMDRKKRHQLALSAQGYAFLRGGDTRRDKVYILPLLDW